jgi:spore coat polysaccharide biosynthesis protein SpsF (cytidylyltransferase family)
MKEDYFKEHVTPVFYKTDHFKASFIEMEESLKGNDIRLTFDTEKDLEIIKNIIRELDTIEFTFEDVLEVLKDNNHYKRLMLESIKQNAK